MRTSLILLLGIPGVSSAATLTVGGGGYGTINDALLAANDGDVIEVEAGDYAETLFIDVDVEIIGLGGLASNSLSGTGAPAVEVDDAVVTLSGFTLNPTADRGIVVTNGAQFTGFDLDVSGFTVTGYDAGAGLFSVDSEVTLTDVVFDSNQSTNADGAAIALQGSLGVLTRVTVSNSNTGGDGALAIDFTDLFVDDSTFTDNVSNDDGGAFELDNDSTATFTSTTFANNASGDDGGAINAEDGGDLIIDGCTFDSNIASDGFGGGSGGAIRIRVGTDSSLSNTLFDGNSAGADGGALDLEEGTHDLSGNTFVGNDAGQLGGALNIDVDGELNVDGDVYDSNVATWGGALYLRDDVVGDIQFATFTGNDATTDRGGAIRSNQGGNGELSVSFSGFNANTANTTGGAISAAAFGNGIFTALNNTFTGNVAAVAGGALYLDTIDDISATANIFCANDGGVEGGAASIVGGGGGTHEWLGNLIVENISANFGGGLRFNGTGDPDISNNTFLGNDTTDGGHIRAFQTSADLVNNIFQDAVDGDGVTQSNTNGNRDYNLWFNNTNNDVGDQLNNGDLGGSAVFADAGFVAYSADGDCSNDDLSLDVGSPAIDAGDPDSAYDDTDGSICDMGYYGGPGAPL